MLKKVDNMIKYQTTAQKKDALIPSRSDFGKILLTRHTNLSSKDRRNILLSEIGEMGENKVIEIMKEFGGKEWTYLKNVWLDKGGRYESDLIVITKSGIYVFEIKNYEGYFEYDNGDCKINNYDLTENCIAQASRAYKKMRSICKDALIDAKVHGVIVFIGEYNPVEIKSVISNIQVIKRSGLKKYIADMLDAEKYFHETSVDTDLLMKQLNHYSIPDPFRFDPLPIHEMSDIRTGICCARCQSFELNFNRRYYVICNCGLEESREEALIRTICDYGVLTYNQNLHPMKIYHFIGKLIPHTSLYRVINKHFMKTHPQKRLGYINKKLPWDKISSQFTIAKPKKLYLYNNSVELNIYNKTESISTTL